ncbi:glycerol kinase [Pusillimonas sp. T2]|uniref:glycerol kinase GlpK n=1 Tax=Pusillimonas sp. T2 TaxID=1548123 RepID=UPI000B9C8364|nr:glycerol kinase GlpK [Pusillimonas sp. T2]OXR49720.1 glycerol kinase [Pusillimonas sp. T2]
MAYLLALDQGTSSSRSIIFDLSGGLIAIEQSELLPATPKPDQVEHDPQRLWQTQLETAKKVIAKANIRPQDILAIGITNQRETVVAWDTRNGTPLCPAIVWQDRRTQARCQQLINAGYETAISKATGLRLDAYFSATKMQWMLENIPDAKRCAEAGQLALGTVDSWLLWQLTRGKSFATDVSNASRTLLFNIHTGQWDTDLLALFGINAQSLPAVLPSSGLFGHTHKDWFGAEIPIFGVAGDQQSALFGQACFSDGMAKNTYGTGCFALMHTGTTPKPSANGLITTRAAQPSAQPMFALEGSVFVGGAIVQWLRDGLNAFERSADIEALAGSVDTAGGVTVVPAFSGLGAPYWQPDARGTITGLTRGTTLAHIARAALESIAFQSTALLLAMSRDTAQQGGLPLSELRVDGGASANNLLMQFQADLLGIPVIRPAVTETTALGAAWLAGLGCGAYTSQNELTQLWKPERVFTPGISTSQAQALMQQWEHAVRQACVPQ